MDMSRSTAVRSLLIVFLSAGIGQSSLIVRLNRWRRDSHGCRLSQQLVCRTICLQVDDCWTAHAAWTYERRAEGTSTTSPAGTGAGFSASAAAALCERPDGQVAAAAVAAACFSCACTSFRQRKRGHRAGKYSWYEDYRRVANAPQCSPGQD